jgi:hypothetical protein
MLLKEETKNEVVVVRKGVVNVKPVDSMEVVVEPAYQRMVFPLGPGVAERDTVPGPQVPA